MHRDAAQHGRFLRMFGGIWAVVGASVVAAFTLLSRSVLHGSLFGAALGAGFALVGALLWMLGASQRKAALRVFRDGVEASGVVIDVQLDRRVRMNGRNPWRVVYEFMTRDGATVRSTATFWEADAAPANPGQPIVALYDPSRPARSVLWTRLG